MSKPYTPRPKTGPTTSAEVMEILESGDGFVSIPIVAGHDLTANELVAFETYVNAPYRMGRVKLAAAAAGFSCQWIRHLRNEQWWIVMQDAFVGSKQREFHMELAARQENITKGFFRVMDGDKEVGKMAGAMVQGAKLFAEMGKNPLIDRRPQVQITNNTQTNVLNMDASKYADMSPEELFARARGKKFEGGG